MTFTTHMKSRIGKWLAAVAGEVPPVNSSQIKSTTGQTLCAQAGVIVTPEAITSQTGRHLAAIAGVVITDDNRPRKFARPL